MYKGKAKMQRKVLYLLMIITSILMSGCYIKEEAQQEVIITDQDIALSKNASIDMDSTSATCIEENCEREAANSFEYLSLPKTVMVEKKDNINAYASIEHMKTANVKAGDYIQTVSYHEGLNKGGGTYRIYEWAPKAVDDGWCVQLNNGTYALLEVKDNTINVTQYGAKGDGITDDSVAINKALANSDMSIYFEDGTYICRSSLFSWSGESLIGSGNATIRFEDRVNMSKYATGGLLTLNGGQILLQNLRFEYVADNDTAFNNHTVGSDPAAGNQGALVKIRSCSKAIINNCGFYTWGEQHPSVCLMWLKAENSDINNVEIANSYFSCLNSNLVGGNLWIQGNDVVGKTVKNMWIHNNEFVKNGNDEILSVVCEATKTNAMENILIENNVFSFVDAGVRNDVFITLGMAGNNNEFHNIKFQNNTINLDGKMNTIISSINASYPEKGDKVIITNNKIVGTVDTDVVCYKIKNSDIEVYGNYYDIKAPYKRVVYTAHDGIGVQNYYNEEVNIECNKIDYSIPIFSEKTDNSNVLFSENLFNVEDGIIKE